MASQGAQRGGARAANRVSTTEDGADFPILCETCLGPNQFVRMIQCGYDKECHVCQRPMKVFRWKPGQDSRYKTTVLCQTCAKVKNCCQCCIFDLEYGLPLAVRDHYARGDTTTQHLSDVQREYFAKQNEVAFANGALTAHQSGETKHATNPELLKLARSTPRYERNRAAVCSFFAKGTCRRGKECPYRHEKAEEGELNNQRIRDRYHGTADPVANKIMRLQRQREEAKETRLKGLADGYGSDDAKEFDPASVPPPTAPSKTGATLMSAPAYPSMVCRVNGFFCSPQWRDTSTHTHTTTVQGLDGPGMIGVAESANKVQKNASNKFKKITGACLSRAFFSSTTHPAVHATRPFLSSALPSRVTLPILR